jgi:uncharacterized protein YceK
MRRYLLILWLAAALLISGCASVFDGLRGTWDGYNNSANRSNTGPSITYPTSPDNKQMLH